MKKDGIFWSKCKVRTSLQGEKLDCWIRWTYIFRVVRHNERNENRGKKKTLFSPVIPQVRLEQIKQRQKYAKQKNTVGLISEGQREEEARLKRKKVSIGWIDGTAK